MSAARFLVLLPAAVAAVLAAFVLRGYEVPSTDHFADVPTLLAMGDPTLYRGDFQVEDALRFNPRTYYLQLIHQTARAGLGIPGAYLATGLLAFAGFVVGCYALGRELGQNSLAGVLLAFFAVAGVQLTLGNARAFYPSPIAQSYAMPFAVWGLWACLTARWPLGYLLFGLAALFQFLVGLLPALLLAPLLLAHAARGRLAMAVTALTLFGALAAAVYVPFRFGGGIGTGQFENAEATYLYCVVRAPEHLMPSSWPRAEYVRFAGLLAAGLLGLWSAPNLDRDRRTVVLVLTGSCVVMLALGYVVVEVWPVASLAVLQPARGTAFVQLALLGVVAARCADWHRRGDSWRAALGATTALSPWGPWCFVGLLFWPAGAATEDPSEPRATVKPLLGFLARATVVLAWFAGAGQPDSVRGWAVVTVTFAGMLVALALPDLLARMSPISGAVVAWAASVAAVVAVAGGMAHKLPGPLDRWLHHRVRPWSVPDDEVTALALRLAQRSDPAASVLIPPGNESFKTFAQRPVVVYFKSFPMSEGSQREWARRLEDVIGAPLDRSTGDTVDEQFGRRTPADLAAVAGRYSADFILTRWHDALPGFVVADRQGPWLLFRRAP